MSKKNIYDPLDAEEKELMDALDDEGWVSAGPEMITKVKLAASNSLKKKKTITFRITENDLNAIKQKAASDGIPYQTLISALVHQYSAGKIKLNL